MDSQKGWRLVPGRTRPTYWLKGPAVELPVKARALIVAVLLALPSQAMSSEVGSMPGWLAGQWQMEDGAAWAEQQWLAPRGQEMLGIGREGFGPQVEAWESMRIAVKPAGKLTLFLQPKGAPATEFALSAASDDAIEFTNLTHPFPQRIRYWRQGQLLMTEQSRMDGSDAVTWHYRPVAPQN